MIETVDVYLLLDQALEEIQMARAQRDQAVQARKEAELDARRARSEAYNCRRNFLSAVNREKYLVRLEYEKKERAGRSRARKAAARRAKPVIRGERMKRSKRL